MVSISMHEASVGVFVPFLENLAGRIERAAEYAAARKIAPEVLVGMRLAPNMYDLGQQVVEANRHATVACALLAGRPPCDFPAHRPDLGAEGPALPGEEGGEIALTGWRERPLASPQDVASAAVRTAAVNT